MANDLQFLTRIILLYHTNTYMYLGNYYAPAPLYVPMGMTHIMK